MNNVGAPGPRRPGGRILVVELLGGVGDVVIFLPTVHALARSHPGARITMAVLEGAVPLVAADPAVHEVLAVAPGPPPAVRAGLAAHLAGRRFDLGVTYTRYGAIPQVVAACSVGAVTDLWRHPPADERIGDRFLRLLVDDGVIDRRTVDPRPQLRVDPRAVEVGRRVVAEAVAGLPTGGGGGRRLGSRPVIALVPRAGMAIKEWGIQRFAGLARALVHRGAVPLVCSAPGPPLDAPIAGVPGTALVGPVALDILAGVFAACDACVAGDTGPARIAAAVDTPTVALFGPTAAGRFGLGPGHAGLDSPVACSERNPLDMTSQACWWSGRCVHEGRTSCTGDIPVAAVLDELARLVPLAAPVRL